MKCKAALIQADGDMDKAVELLRKQNKEAQDKFVDRVTAEGRVAAYVDPEKKVGGLLQLECETAPTAKSDVVVKLANDLAKQVAVQGEAAVDAFLAQPFVDAPAKTVNDRIGEAVGLVRENMKPARMAKLTGLVGSYVHHDGSVAVLLAVEGASTEQQLLREVCMHIAAKNPAFGKREDVPADRVAKEREIARAQIDADPKNKSKPPQILDKIAEGKLKTWFGEHVLLEQPFVKDDTKTVGDLLRTAGLKLGSFVRFKVGKEVG
jgi:elongation factor Ts